eukprot:8519262-Lingulodinium_polyedra.AAC.1
MRKRRALAPLDGRQDKSVRGRGPLEKLTWSQSLRCWSVTTSEPPDSEKGFPVALAVPSAVKKRSEPPTAAGSRGP